MTYRCRCLFLAVLLALGLSSRTEAQIGVSDLLADDPRLQKPVTIRYPRLFIGELLEQVAAQTGVNISASDKDEAAGERVAVFVDKLPLYKLMDALPAILSTKRTRWRWQQNKSTTGGQVTYQLIRPLSSQQLAINLRKEISSDFYRQAQELFARVSAQDDSMGAHSNDDSVNQIANSERLRNGLRLFTDIFSEDERKSLISSLGNIIINYSDLPPSGQSFARDQYEDMRRTFRNDGAASVPSTLKFEFRQTDGNITPSFFISVGNGKQEFGHGYLGGTTFENRWRGKLADEWFLTGDAKESTFEEQQLAIAKAPRPVWEAKHPFYAKLAQFADGIKNPVIAYLPPEKDLETYTVGTPTPSTVSKFLGQLSGFAIVHKWRGDMLLITSPLAPLQNVPINWTIVKALRADKQRNGHLLSIEALMFASAKLNPIQLSVLGVEEFGVLKSLNAWQWLLAPYFERKPLWEETCAELGINLGDAPSSVRAGFREKLDKTTYDGVRTLQCSVRDGDKDKDGVRARMLNFVLKDVKGDVVAEGNFLYEREQSLWPQ